MSQSPANAEEAKNPQPGQSSYRSQLRELDDILNHGGSLSGNERNCVFLNLGASPGTRFANVGSVTGLDFKDDGRAYALSDWDQDGDIDVFAMNRTAPRIRFLRNDCQTNNDFVSVELQGTRGNRDGIGARVTVEVISQGETKRINKVLRAGEGFLSQASKRLVIGLGQVTQIKRVIVEWPNGTKESFSNVQPNETYRLIEGSGIADKTSREQKIPLRSKPFEPPPLKEQAAVLLASRISLPALPYQRMDGSAAAIAAPGLPGKPILINLWATWCAPCREELKRLVELQREDGDLVVLALSVDLLDDQAGPELQEEVRKVAKLYQQPGMFGFASQQMVGRLQFMDDLLFAQKRPLPVPTSFLIDRKGALVAVYRGTVENDVIRNDLSKLELVGKARYDAALPFGGFWHQPRAQGPPIRLVTQMAVAGELMDAAQYLLNNQQSMKRQQGCANLAAKLASRLSQTPASRRTSEGQITIDLYRLAVEQDPDNVPVLNNLAWLLATEGQDDATRQEAVRLARKAAQITRFNSLSVLDTLATAYAAAGQTREAILVYQRALALAIEQKDPNADKFRASVKRLQQGR